MIQRHMRNILVMAVATIAATGLGAQEFYGGASFGTTSVSDDGQPLSDGPNNIGCTMGKVVGRTRDVEFSVELSGLTSVSDGSVAPVQHYSYYDNANELNQAQLDALASQWTWRLWSIGIYNVARVGRDVYVLGKVGFAADHLSVDIGGTHSSTDFGISVGAGIGAHVSNNVITELSATMIDRHIAGLGLMVGLRH